MEIAMMILLVICVLGLLGLGAYVFKEGIIDRDMFSMVVGLFIILMVIAPGGYLGYDLYEKSNCVIKTTTVNSYVTNKEHKPSYTTMVMSGKVLVPIVHAEEHNLTFQYKDVNTMVNTTLDNEQLYTQVNKGEKIQMNLKTYTQHNGKVYQRELELPTQ